MHREHGRVAPTLTTAASLSGVVSSAALTHCGRGSFRPIPNPAKHLLAHREAEKLSGLDDESSPRPCVHVTLTHNQPRRSVRLLMERERPGEVVWGRTLSHWNATAQNK